MCTVTTPSVRERPEMIWAQYARGAHGARRGFGGFAGALRGAAGHHGKRRSAPCAQAVVRAASGPRRARGADSTCVRRGSSQRTSQLQDRLPRPSTHDLKAGLHHLSHGEAYGPTWSSLGSSLAKSTFCRPTREALRSGGGTVSGHLWSGKTPLYFHL